jgi:large subunit ribosomal protein L30
MAKSLKITRTRGNPGRLKRQIKTLEALGLKRIRQSVERPDNPQTRGMINVVRHMVKVEEV